MAVVVFCVYVHFFIYIILFFPGLKGEKMAAAFIILGFTRTQRFGQGTNMGMYARMFVCLQVCRNECLFVCTQACTQACLYA